MEYCGQILGWHYYSFIVWLLEYLSLWHYDNVWKGQFLDAQASLEVTSVCVSVCLSVCLCVTISPRELNV